MKLSINAYRAWLCQFIVIASGAQAQTENNIQGRIVDAVTAEPVPFATLSIADGQFSNETNADGYFRFTLPEQFRQDTVTVTAINYRTRRLSPTAVDRTEPIIRLDRLPAQTQVAAPDSYFAIERPFAVPDSYFAIERPFAVRDTLLKVVASIAVNYSNKPMLLRGFYRETIKTEKSNLTVLYSEGTVDIYKPSYYFTKKDDQIRFIKGRRRPLKLLSIPVITPGPWVSSMLDVVKYQEFLFRNGKVNKDYLFEIAGNASYNDHLIYVIRFRPRSARASGGYFVGNLFVESGSLAIIRAEYELTPAGMSLLNKSRYAQVYATELVKRRYVATYTKFDGRWSFQSGSVENTLMHKPEDSPLHSRIDFVVTNRQSVGIKPFKASELADYTRLPMTLFDKTDATFWRGENYLLPVVTEPD